MWEAGGDRRSRRRPTDNLKHTGDSAQVSETHDRRRRRQGQRRPGGRRLRRDRHQHEVDQGDAQRKGRARRRAKQEQGQADRPCSVSMQVGRGRPGGGHDAHAQDALRLLDLDRSEEGSRRQDPRAARPLQDRARLQCSSSPSTRARSRCSARARAGPMPKAPTSASRSAMRSCKLGTNQSVDKE